MPIAQLWTHLMKLGRISELQLYIANDHKKLETVQSEEERKQIHQEINQELTEIDETKTELQKFKIYAGMLESAPQVVLQLSILLKKIYNEDTDELYDPIVIFQICSSIGSV